jgi:predicted nucleic acid-binding Zn ribbon protein
MITMDHKYKDGSDHLCCPDCGFCIPCDDCEQFGCRKNEQKRKRKRIIKNVLIFMISFLIGYFLPDLWMVIK